MNYRKDGPLLFLSGKSYSRYMGYLNKKKLENENIEQEKAHRKHLKETSDEMANSWPDSIKNIKNREMKRLEMREKLLEEERAEQVEHYQHFHQEERLHYLAEAKKKIKMKRYPNLILSNALLESQVRTENMAMLKLKKKQQREEAENEARWSERVLEKDQKNKRREEEENCQARLKSKMVQALQLKQIREKSKSASNKKSERLKEEQELLMKMNEEIRERRENEIEDAKQLRKEMKEYMRAQSLRRKRTNHILKAEEAEEQAVCRIYNDFHTTRVCLIENQRKQEMNDFSKTKHMLGSSNKRNDDENEKKQNEMLLSQCMELQMKYEQEKDRDTKQKEEMAKELNTYYRDCWIRKNEEDKLRAEILRYKLAERLKDTEEIKKYDDTKKGKIRQSARHFAKEWDKQIEEKKQLIRTKSSQNSATDFHEFQDERFFSYAKEVLEYAKEKGMDDSPIKRKIEKYCMKYKLSSFPKCLKMEGTPSSRSGSSEVKLPKI